MCDTKLSQTFFDVCFLVFDANCIASQHHPKSLFFDRMSAVWNIDDTRRRIHFFRKNFNVTTMGCEVAY